MKANEAPEKLYLLPNALISYFRNTDEDIEYTRKDAFIEKACEFIKERLNFDDNAWYIAGEVTIKDRVIEDFKDYMKRE